MLQVEQEKQFTHQALQRADTTVRPDVELAGPSKPAAGPARQSLSQMDLQLWNTPPPTTNHNSPTLPHPHNPLPPHQSLPLPGEQTGREQGRKGLGDRGLTITLYHMTAVVTDIPKQLWTKQAISTAHRQNNLLSPF